MSVITQAIFAISAFLQVNVCEKLHTVRKIANIWDMKHSEWLTTTTGDSVRNVAITIGVAPRTLATQLEKERISPENVIKIAEAYEAHPVGALVATEYLDTRWAEGIDPEMAVRELTDEQLANEILRRLRDVRGDHDAFHTPVADLDARRSNTSDGDVDSLPYAANRRPLEPEEGDDDYGPGA